MTDIATLLRRTIEGFVCEGVSDGDRLCTGCWDASDCNVSAANDIPAGEPIYWRHVNIEYDEWDPYCERCAAVFDELS